MNAIEFIETVRRMRAAQKAYFSNGRKQTDLVDAKRLEKEVDQALQHGVMVPGGVIEMDGEPGEGIQIGMFVENGDETKNQ